MMNRRNFVRNISLTGLTSLIANPVRSITSPKFDSSINENSREYWVQVLTKIAHPVLSNLSKGTLKRNMPIEFKGMHPVERGKVSHLEAIGRLLAGIAPWIELGGNDTPEGIQRLKFAELCRQSISNSVNPDSPDYMNFSDGGQPLVDTAFFIHGLLRAPNELWEKLPQQTKQQVVDAVYAARKVNPPYNNWLLFAAINEAFLMKIGAEYDQMRIDYAVRKHLEWYKGDGLYGDGEDFHWDYYNSYVIQPMLLDTVEILKDSEERLGEHYETVLNRAKRYAEIQERLISPEGTFPPIGRSLPYRFGAFQLLSQIALWKELPENIKPAQVRSALSLVIKKMIDAPGTFDEKGWLRIGFVGHQPDIAESYISTGSLYLCSVGLLPLGLPAENEFWSAPAADWTAKKIWNGEDLPRDHALYEKK